MILLLLGCRAPPAATDPPPAPTGPGSTWILHSGGGGPDTAAPVAGHSADSGQGGGGSAPGDPCSGEPPPGPFPHSSTRLIQTEEDFDFDRSGFLLTQSGTSLAGVTRAGSATLLVGDVGLDPTGIRSLPSGEVLVGQPDTGDVLRADLATAGTAVAASGLLFPNGLEVASTGVAYVSERLPRGRVFEFDPWTGDKELVAELTLPNAMVLSPDEQTLYVATSTRTWPGTLVALDRGPDGSWSPPRVIFEGAVELGGLTVDQCGDLYAVEASWGRVFRLRIPEGAVEPIADLPTNQGYFSAMHFSPGHGGWSTTELYVSSRVDFYSIDVGVEGRHLLR